MRELFYYSDPTRPNRVSVCGIYDEGTIAFGAARLGDNDNFIKKVGRDKARGRALSHPVLKVSVPDDTVIKVFSEHAKLIAQKVRITPSFKEKSFIFEPC